MQETMENRKLNILFISSWYPNKLKPLNGIFVKRHAEAVTKDCNVSAIFVRSDKNYAVEESVEDGIYTLHGYYKNPAVKIPGIYQLVKFVRYISLWRKLLFFYRRKKGKPDLIHSNIVYPVSVLATFVKIVWRVPYIIYEHWTGYMPEHGLHKGFIKKTLSRIAVSRAEAIVTPSLVLSQAMQSFGLMNKYFVIANVVDTESFSIPPSAQHRDGGFHFMHISSLDDHQKNVTGIVRTFKKFHALHPQTKLTIVWDEEKTEAMETIQTEESFSEQDGIYLLGKKTGTELVSIFQQADAFILFSNFETQSIVLLEAISCGIPVISSRCGGPEEFITPLNGLLVDKGNEIQLEEAMENMLKNRNRYHPEEVRNSVMYMVSKDAVAQKIMNLYKNVLGLIP